MNLLCFDVSSGGISAALLDSQLADKKASEQKWDLETDERGAATLPVPGVVAAFKQAIQSLKLTKADTIDAVCIGTFMHNCVLLDEADGPLTPVFTWLDLRGDAGLDYIRSRLGDRFHDVTGCRYHPMFPVFKLAAIRATDSELLSRTKRVVSLRALLVHQLTGTWGEDHGLASASGLFNITQGDWDSEILKILGLERAQLPPIVGRTKIMGQVTSRAATEFGLPGIPVIAGSGDGFLANLGSECEVPAKISVTLGTSAAVRQTLNEPVLDLSAGTFCYRAGETAVLLGCASSNGGNVLDWGRQIFGTLEDAKASENPPILIPLLHGERSPDWNPNLTGSWHGLTANHTAADLSRSILEGVIFNLAHFVEIVQQASGEKATDLVLSGNGFLDPAASPTLAAIAGVATWMLRTPGLASLRGAGVCALRALAQPVPALNVDRVSPLADSKIHERYREYRRLRGGHGGGPLVPLAVVSEGASPR
jgi:gluconokinase